MIQSELENERKSLLDSLDKEKKDRLRELADKDREKVQATGIYHSQEGRYVEEGYASSHKGDEDIVVGFEEGVAGYDYSFDGVVEPSVDYGVGVSVKVDGEVVVQEFKVVGASHQSQAGYRDP